MCIAPTDTNLNPAPISALHPQPSAHSYYVVEDIECYPYSTYMAWLLSAKTLSGFTLLILYFRFLGALLLYVHIPAECAG